MRRKGFWWVALAIVVVAAGLGFLLTAALGPQRLEREVRHWLEQATGQPVEIGQLRLVPGLPVDLEGDGLVLWGGALRVERASARIDISSLLAGEFRLSRLRLDGAELQVRRSQVSPPGGDGDPADPGQFVWSPPIFSGDPMASGEPALAPLQIVDGVARFLLDSPLLADTLVLRRSRVVIDPGSALPDAARLEFGAVDGRLLHSRLFGDARLFLRARPGGPGAEPGELEWSGTRDPDGQIQLEMKATDVDLALATPYLKALRSEARLAGRLEGTLAFESAEAGSADLQLDWVARDFEARFPESRDAEPWSTPALRAKLAVDLEPDAVTLSDARISTGPLQFALEAAVARPVTEQSRARLSVSVGDLAANVQTARTLSGWLPASARDRVRVVTDRIRAGRIARARISGITSITGWSDTLAGRLDPLPRSLRLEVDVEDVALDVDDANRIDELSGRFVFAGDAFEAKGARADLNDDPLPQLDLRFEGVGALLSAPPQPRAEGANVEALVGLTPLWDTFRPKDPDADAPPPPRIDLRIERLRHPALFWPVAGVNVQLEFQPDSDGLRLEVARCRWGGVVLDGEVDWTIRPDRRLAIELVATPAPEEAPAPDAVPAAPEDASAWAVGRFEVGPIEGKRWRQRAAAGRFRAEAGRLALDEVEIALAPQGTLAGEISLDLARTDAVPYSLDAKLRDGDVGATIELFGGNPETVTGGLALEGSLRGTLVPGRSLVHDADGRIALDAREGTIARSVPPVFALALAAQSLNPFSGRDRVRFRSGRGVFTFAQGVVSTDALDLDGPDLRMFASGSVDLREGPFPLDAEVALFLFRQLDWAVGKIPILNALLLGDHQNLVAAYFRLMGSWREPDARMQPLKTLEEGPVDVLTKGIPRVVQQGMKAIGGLFRRPSGSPAPSPVAPAVPPTPDPAATPRVDASL